jgi:hypothetical protein
MNDLEREISLHKDRWCKFNCQRRGMNAVIVDEDGHVKDRNDICQFCQVDAFIRELVDQKVIEL